MDRLDSKRVSLSLAIVSALLSLLCALFIVLAPAFSMRLFGSIFHGLDITRIAAPMTLPGVVSGLLAVTVSALVAGWLFATVYNLMASGPT